MPETPSRIRVAVWRAVRRLGATAVARSAYVLPDTPVVRQRLAHIRAKTEATWSIFTGRFLDPADEAVIVDQARRDRASEYEEILEKCDDFLRDLAKEVNRRNFTLEEVEENEADCNKLRTWFREAQERDWLGLPLRSLVDKRLGRCRVALDCFALTVQKRLEE